MSPAAGDFHNPEVRQYAYDLDRANEILDELGWLDSDGDGIREDDMGNPISFSLVTNEGNSVRADITGIIHEGMAAIGLEVDFRIVDFGDMVAQLTATYDWEAMVVGLTGSADPFGGMTVWHSGEGLHLWHPNQPEPATEWEAEIDELYIAGSRGARPRSSGCSTTGMPRPSSPRTCRSSTPRSRSGWERFATCSGITPRLCTATGTFATCTALTSRPLAELDSGEAVQLVQLVVGGYQPDGARL